MNYYRISVYVVIYTLSLAIRLPFGMSWIVSFWALCNLAYHDKQRCLISDRRATWMEIIVLAALPMCIFVLHDVFPLKIDEIFRQDTSHGQEVWFPGVFYLPLYVIPLFWRKIVRKESFETLGFRLNFWHVSLMILTLVPIAVINFQTAYSVDGYFDSVPDRSLWAAAAKPFYFNGLWEELYFRGLIFSLLLTRMRVVPAILLSSMIFSLSHYEWMLSAGEMEFVDFAGEFCGNFGLGLVTAFAFWYTGSVWPGILFHSLASGSAYLTAYLVRIL